LFSPLPGEGGFTHILIGEINMKNTKVVTVIGIMGILATLGSLTLSGCGGGGGGGVAKQTTKLYLFGSMSSNSIIATVTTSVAVPNFIDYSAPSKTAKGIFPLRSRVLAASGPVLVSDITGSTYDNNTGKLTVILVNGGFLNMSSSTTRNSGKGTEIATLTTTPGTTFPLADTSPSVGQQRTSPVSTSFLGGCKVNYAP
jgi:hypothetical protein